MGDLSDIKDRTPNQNTINSIRKLLEQAESGELRSLFYVAGLDDDRVCHGWSLDCRSGRRMMLAEMIMSQHDFVVNLELQERDSILAEALG